VPDQDDVIHARPLDLTDGRFDAVGDGQGVEVAWHVLPPGQVNRQRAGTRRITGDGVDDGCQHRLSCWPP